MVPALLLLLMLMLRVSAVGAAMSLIRCKGVGRRRQFEPGTAGEEAEAATLTAQSGGIICKSPFWRKRLTIILNNVVFGCLRC